LAFPDKQCCTLDPCVGDGAAFAEIASDKKVSRYGIELDAGRAEQARAKGIDVIHGNCFDAQCPVESFSLIYLNPPYDFELGEERSQRMEKLFLEHAYRWLKPGGVLVLVVPAKRVADCAVVLSRNFREMHVYRLTEPESIRYEQVVVLGIRRTRQERDRLRDNEIVRVQLWLGSLERKLEELPPLPAEPDRAYALPPGPSTSSCSQACTPFLCESAGSSPTGQSENVGGVRILLLLGLTSELRVHTSS
jgi:SAM-dependent methyltransferase